MIETRRLEPTHPHAVELLGAMETELTGIYGPLTIDRTPSAKPDDLAAFVVVYEDGAPVAGGAVKRLGDGLGEIKRMYVVPDARRRGHGRRLLTGLEEVARELEFDRVRLDTGPAQPHAQALYESSGYTPIGNYNDNSYASYWGEKAL